MTAGLPVRSAGPTAPSRLRLLALALPAGALALVANTVATAPQPPVAREGWRWATIAIALGLCAANLACAARAYRRVGPLSVVAFLHVWMLLAFSFPAAEMTYRYAALEMHWWRAPTDDPLVVEAVLLVAAFQLLFFAALGRRFDRPLAAVLLASRASRPDRRLALVFGLLLLPLLAARLQVLGGLGVQGAAGVAVTRGDYLEDLAGAVHPAVFLLNVAFPILAVTLLCLVVKYAVPHPSRTGRRLYVLTMLASAAAVVLSGGRAELVYVVVTVAVFLYVSGYRAHQQLAPAVAAAVVVAGLLFLVAQARVGQANALSSLAGNPYVGYSYASGDLTQILGLGRFDAVVLILDRHDPGQALLGSSYVAALAGAANAAYLPLLALGEHLPSWHVGDSVLGPWVFGDRVGSPLPSAPGELYLNFGVLGVLAGALALGLLARVLLRLPALLGGSAEFAWLLVVWTVARTLSDESYVMATFAARNWPLMVALSLLLLRRAPTLGTHGAPRPSPPSASATPPPPARAGCRSGREAARD